VADDAISQLCERAPDVPGVPGGPGTSERALACATREITAYMRTTVGAAVAEALAVSADITSRMVGRVICLAIETYGASARGRRDGAARRARLDARLKAHGAMAAVIARKRHAAQRGAVSVVDNGAASQQPDGEQAPALVDAPPSATPVFDSDDEPSGGTAPALDNGVALFDDGGASAGHCNDDGISLGLVSDDELDAPRADDSDESGGSDAPRAGSASGSSSAMVSPETSSAESGDNSDVDRATCAEGRCAARCRLSMKRRRTFGAHDHFGKACTPATRAAGEWLSAWPLDEESADEESADGKEPMDEEPAEADEMFGAHRGVEQARRRSLQNIRSLDQWADQDAAVERQWQAETAAIAARRVTADRDHQAKRKAARGAEDQQRRRGHSVRERVRCITRRAAYAARAAECAAMEHQAVVDCGPAMDAWIAKTFEP
jgi:hypothetical protein